MADAKTTTTRTAAPESKDNEQSKGPVTNSGETGTAEGLNTHEGREAQTRVEDERLKSLNEANAEGHAKNLEKIEKDAAAAHEASEKGPTSGREWNRNTPRIDAQGNKHWE